MNRVSICLLLITGLLPLPALAQDKPAQHPLLQKAAQLRAQKALTKVRRPLQDSEWPGADPSAWPSIENTLGGNNAKKRPVDMIMQQTGLPKVPAGAGDLQNLLGGKANQLRKQLPGFNDHPRAPTGQSVDDPAAAAPIAPGTKLPTNPADLEKTLMDKAHQIRMQNPGFHDHPRAKPAAPTAPQEGQ